MILLKMYIFKDRNKISDENTSFNFISFVITVVRRKKERQNLVFKKFKELTRKCETENL